MCGIAGFIDKTNTSNKEILTGMTDVINHRGPDGSGAHLLRTADTTIGLGHRRLSIIDLKESAGQPMHFKEWHIVYNGEIYNYKEIKEELSALGRIFETDSDTEVILQAFDEWGVKSVDKFIGMFAFVIVNEQLSKTWLFRDRAGVKPLFYFSKAHVFLFASELKSFHEHPAFTKELNMPEVAAYLQYGYIPAPRTIFKDCYKIQPGHYIEFDLTRFTYEQKRYWSITSFYNKPTLTISFEEAKKETETLLKSACAYRMVADVPVGVFLSGGYDSSTVAALLQAEQTEKIKTFSIGFHEAEINEAPHAKKIAKHLGTDHTELYCTVDDAVDLIRDIPYFWDEPFADASAIPTMLVSKMAAKKVKVALSADAGDELFGGYTKYSSLLTMQRYLKYIPSQWKKLLTNKISKINPSNIPVLNSMYNYETRFYKGLALLNTNSPATGLETLASFFTIKELDNLFIEPLQWGSLLNDIEISTSTDALATMLNIDFQTYMVDDVLTKVDRATMHISLEGREPLLDHRLAEWAAQLPSSFKIKNGQKKYILKEICHQYIPKQLMDRPKMGFGIPMVKWFEEEIDAFINDYCSQKFIEQQGIFNFNSIQQLLSVYNQNKSANVHKLWNLLQFQLWFHKWMM